MCDLPGDWYGALLVPSASLRRWTCYLEALLALVVASILIKAVPFRAVAASCARVGPASRAPNSENTAYLVQGIRGWSARLPWRTVCYQKGVALHFLLRLHGMDSQLVYGIRIAGGDLAAHVWVELGGSAVLGGQEAYGFNPVARFPACLDGC